MLKVVEFMKEHKNWEELLTQAPYFLKVYRDEVFGRHFVMIKYNALFAVDFSIELVRECRGIIIDEDTLEPVVIPFFKFGNYGESYCPDIDWRSAVISEKRDGSLIKVVKLGDNYLISSNGCIDAFKAELQADLRCPYKTFGELFMVAMGDRLSLLKEGKTYMFELTSPYNRIVVPYTDVNIALIGIRDNTTFKEELIFNSELKDYFLTPKVYGFKTLDECIAAAKELPYSEEGYVVVDKFFNRVKVKSLAYVNVHHLRGEGVMTEKRVVNIIKTNEVEEVLTYFPEYKDLFNEYKNKLQNLCLKYSTMWDNFQKELPNLSTRKDIALFLQSNKDYDMKFIFSCYDGKVQNIKKYIYDLPLEKTLLLL